MSQWRFIYNLRYLGHRGAWHHLQGYKFSVRAYDTTWTHCISIYICKSRKESNYVTTTLLNFFKINKHTYRDFFIHRRKKYCLKAKLKMTYCANLWPHIFNVGHSYFAWFTAKSKPCLPYAGSSSQVSISNRFSQLSSDWLPLINRWFLAGRWVCVLAARAMCLRRSHLWHYPDPKEEKTAWNQMFIRILTLSFWLTRITCTFTDNIVSDFV